MVPSPSPVLRPNYVRQVPCTLQCLAVALCTNAVRLHCRTDGVLHLQDTVGSNSTDEVSGDAVRKYDKFDLVDIHALLVLPQGTTSKNQYQQAQDGVQLGEHSQYHGSTECVMTSTDGTDTVGTNLCLTKGREQTNKTTCKTYTEDGARIEHGDVRSNKTLKHKEAYKTIQTLDEGKAAKPR